MNRCAFNRWPGAVTAITEFNQRLNQLHEVADDPDRPDASAILAQFEPKNAEQYNTRPTRVGWFSHWYLQSSTMDEQDQIDDLLPKRFTGGSLRAWVSQWDQYAAAISQLLDNIPPQRFTYRGWRVTNKEALTANTVRRFLDGLDYLEALFKRRGVQKCLHAGVAAVRLEVGDPATPHAWYNPESSVLTFTAKAVQAHPPTILTEWFKEVFLHEFGHYVHTRYITDEARDSWAEPWRALEPLKSWEKYEKAKADHISPITDYGSQNEHEDFAETFVAFMDAPGKLTPTAKYRMQRALSLSGLHGKPVMRLAKRVLARYLRATPATEPCF